MRIASTSTTLVRRRSGVGWCALVEADGRFRVEWREGRSSGQESSQSLPRALAIYSDTLAGLAERPRPGRRFGDALRRLLHRRRVFALIESTGSWTQGGCWVLGVALVKWMGGDARLEMTVADNRRGADHVVVSSGGLYFDGDGAQSTAELLDKMTNLERAVRPRVVAFDLATVERVEAVATPCGGIPDRLVDLLDRHFGPSAPLEPRWRG